MSEGEKESSSSAVSGETFLGRGVASLVSCESHGSHECGHEGKSSVEVESQVHCSEDSC